MLEFCRALMHLLSSIAVEVSADDSVVNGAGRTSEAGGEVVEVGSVRRHNFSRVQFQSPKSRGGVGEIVRNAADCAVVRRQQ